MIRTVALLLCLGLCAAPAAAQQTPLGGHVTPIPQDHIYNPGQLAPRDSALKVRVGQAAPDFRLKSIGGDWVRLSDYRGRNYVVLSFVPAAWTPVCSDQWPSYNLGRKELEKRGAVILGITVDNIPTLHAWTREMDGCWFPVLSDFYPHGRVAARYGVLRSSGVTERALFVIDRKGVIRAIDVHDINAMPRLEDLVATLDRIRAEDASRKK